MRLEALRRALDSDENLRARLTAGDGNNPQGQLPAGTGGEAGNEGALPPMARPLMALMAAAQSAELTGAGDVNALNPVGVQPTDLAVGSSLAPSDFSMADSASATATVIAAALLLASQANRRNAGGDSGRPGAGEASQNGEEVQLAALADNTTATIEEVPVQVPIEGMTSLSASTAEEVTSAPEICSETSVKPDEVAPPVIGESTASAATDMAIRWVPPVVNESTASAATDVEQSVACEIGRQVEEQRCEATTESGNVPSGPDPAVLDEPVSPVEEHEADIVPSPSVDRKVEHSGKSCDEVAEATASAALEAAMLELAQESNEEGLEQQNDDAANSDSGSAGGRWRLEEISEWGQEEEEEEALAFALRDLPVDSVQQDSCDDEEDDAEAEEMPGDGSDEIFYDFSEDEDEDFVPIIYETLSEWDGELIDDTFQDSTSGSLEQSFEERVQGEATSSSSVAQPLEESLQEERQVQVSDNGSPQPCSNEGESRDAEDDWI